MQSTFGSTPAPTTQSGVATLCVQPSSGFLQPQQSKTFGSGTGNFGFQPCVTNGFGGNGSIRNGCFGHNKNPDGTVKTDGTQTTNPPDSASEMDPAQKLSNENNQLFAKIIENEFYNIPMHLKLDCMQEMLGVMKKYTPKKTI